MKLVSERWLRFYTASPESGQVLILSTLFSMGMILCRMVYTGNNMFIFLVWNLFLAFVPFALSGWLVRHLSGKRIWIFFLSVFIWLVFIPNAFYIITDLFHLEQNNDIPLWFDLALILSFAWNGLMLGIMSVRQMERVFESYFNQKFDLLFILPVMAMNGLGVYVGRYLRFNSWDILSDPLQLSKDIFYLFIHPLRYRFDWSMIVCYTVLMTVIYLTIKKLSKVL